MNYGSTKQILLNNGYSPIPCIGKHPALDNWREHIAPEGYGGYNTGILCGKIAAVDIDVTDKESAEQMQGYVLRTCGETVYRIGKAPKVLLVYRSSGNRKKTSKQYDCGRIEILGEGQQFVAFGTHPDTKRPYTWPSILGSILDISAASLPVISEEQMGGIIDAFEGLMAEKGFKPLAKESTLTGDKPDYDPDDPLDQVGPVGLTNERCKEILSGLDPDCSRDEWRNIGMALHYEFQGAPEALELWDEWSAKGTKYKEGEPERQWESFGHYQGKPLTGAYLLKQGKTKEDPWSEPDFFKKLDWSTSRFLSNPPEVPMVINGFLPRGIVSLFYSAGGAGKSTILLYMAIRIALAKKYDTDFLGHCVNGGKVVIITAEDPELILNRRFIGVVQSIAEELNISIEEIRSVLNENLSIVSTFSHSIMLFKLRNDGILLTTEYYKSMLSCLSEISDLQLVVIDTKTRYSPGEGEGNVTATQEITYYERIAKTTGASVMLLHHTNKSSRDGSQTGATAYRDASALFDSVRAAWYLRGLTELELKAQDIPENTPGTFLLLENSKNNYIEVNKPMLLHRVGFNYSTRPLAEKLTPAQKKEADKERAYNKVFELLQVERGEWYTQAHIIEVCKDIGLGRRRVIEALGELVEDALLENAKGANYSKYRIIDKMYGVTMEGDLL